MEMSDDDSVTDPHYVEEFPWGDEESSEDVNLPPPGSTSLSTSTGARQRPRPPSAQPTSKKVKVQVKQAT